MDANIKGERQVAARQFEKMIRIAKRHSHTAVPFCYAYAVGGRKRYTTKQGTVPYFTVLYPVLF